MRQAWTTTSEDLAASSRAGFPLGEALPAEQSDDGGWPRFRRHRSLPRKGPRRVSLAMTPARPEMLYSSAKPATVQMAALSSAATFAPEGGSFKSLVRGSACRTMVIKNSWPRQGIELAQQRVGVVSWLQGV